VISDRHSGFRAFDAAYIKTYAKTLPGLLASALLWRSSRDHCDGK
jgi:hypothetical protein